MTGLKTNPLGAPTRFTLFLTLLGLTLSGCNSPFGEQAAKIEQVDQSAGFTGADDAEADTEAEIEQSVADAREQVLAFIDRIEPPAEAADAAQREPFAPSPRNRSQPKTEQVEQRTPNLTVSNGPMANTVLPLLESHEQAKQTPTKPRVVRVSVRETYASAHERKLEPETETGPRSLANSTPDERDGRDEHPSIHALMSQLEKRVAAAPEDVDAAYRLAMLRLGVGERIDDFRVPSGASARSAQLLTSAVKTAAAMGRALRDPTSEADAALSAVDTMRQALSGPAGLTIPTVAFCSNVRGFGLIDELESNTFRAGSANQAIVYFTVEHFASVLENGLWRTELSERLEVWTEDGEMVWEQTEPRIEDRCGQRRRDFFIAQRIMLPARLSTGKYVLKVTVEDVIAEKQTQATHAFTVHSGLSIE